MPHIYPRNKPKSRFLAWYNFPVKNNVRSERFMGQKNGTREN